MHHPLSCRCGTLQGYVELQKPVNRGVCYCRDCQAFAHFLGKANEVLDRHGGTDVVQTLPAYVHIEQGKEALACMRLSEKGLLRWYASCCKTPIGNTLATYKLPFVGLVHACLDSPERTLDESFGPIRMHVNTDSAKGDPKPKPTGMAGAVVRLLGLAARSRISGSYRKTPFFNVPEGTPVSSPTVLTQAERSHLKRNL